MDFLSDAMWWILLVAASLFFARSCRLGAWATRSTVDQVVRTSFVSVVAVGFIFTGWTGGVALAIASGLLGQALAMGIVRSLVKPLLVTQPRPMGAPQPTGPLGRRALLRDMIQNGISREKVRGLIQRGTLVAHEDPDGGKISLVRPEDLPAVEPRDTGEENQSPDSD